MGHDRSARRARRARACSAAGSTCRRSFHSARSALLEHWLEPVVGAGALRRHARARRSRRRTALEYVADRRRGGHRGGRYRPRLRAAQAGQRSCRQGAVAGGARLRARAGQQVLRRRSLRQGDRAAGGRHVARAPLARRRRRADRRPHAPAGAEQGRRRGARHHGADGRSGRARRRLDRLAAPVRPGRARMPGCSSWVCCSCSAPSPSANAMREFLLSIGYDRWILPALLALPLVGAALVLLGGWTRAGGGGRGRRWPRAPRRHASPRSSSPLEFLLSLGLWWTFDAERAGLAAACSTSPWIPSWGARFTLGLDGIALMMVLLTTFIMLLAVVRQLRRRSGRRPRRYYALLLVLTTGMLGVFMALDLFLFYVMWEVMLVPMYFIIGIWGGERRIYASLKFFIYTMIGSLLMLVAIVYLGPRGAGPDDRRAELLVRRDPARRRTSRRTRRYWLFGAFFLAFAVKVPMFPFHTWLPDAHVEAPTAGSVVLAAIMLKLGTFGFIRLAVPLFPGAAMDPDGAHDHPRARRDRHRVRRARRRSCSRTSRSSSPTRSVSHLGFVMLGIFALTVQSVQGALMVMINHGISTGALFFLIGMIYERRHTRLHRGLRRHRPRRADVRRAAHRRRRSAPSACPAPTASSASSSCCSARSARYPVLRAHRGDERDLRRRLSALGHPAHPLQPARQARERARARPQPP